MPKYIDTVCRFFYELILLLTVLILLLAPFHLKATRHFNITKIIDHSTVSFTTDHAAGITLGDSFPVYRFNPDWTSEIGRVHVTGINKDEVICSFDPATFRWPMGRQGLVVGTDGPKVKVNMGSDLGLKVDDFLILYKERQSIGRIKLTEIFDSYAYGQVVSGPAENLNGLTASEFIIPTQIVVFKNTFLSFIEICLFLIVFLLYSYVFIAYKTSLLALMGKSLKSTLKPMMTMPVYFIFQVLLGVPFIWFTVSFSISLLTYLLSSIIPLVSILQQNIQLFYASGATAYLYVLFKEKKSPILILWHWVRFKPGKNNIAHGRLRNLIIWALHLLIAYAFAQSLFSFLSGNIHAITSLAWRPLQRMSLEDIFSILRYALWSLTILGCLLGYGHSIFGYIWGKRIRELDFTVMGWLTNAVCYGPLLGFIIWQMVPSFRGVDPIITQGPLYIFCMIVELCLNLLYTLSIWNLGTMFGVMTDKGVRTSSLYSVVRHPSYTLETLMFLVVFLNGLSGFNEWMSISLFIFIYYVRSEREDQFMSASNPDYLIYKNETPYKFIPGLY